MVPLKPAQRHTTFISLPQEECNFQFRSNFNFDINIWFIALFDIIYLLYETDLLGLPEDLDFF